MDEITPQLARERVAEAYRRTHDERLSRSSGSAHQRSWRRRILGRRP